MRLITIGGTTEKLNYKANLQNYRTWNAMSEYFDEIFIVVESPDDKTHFETIGKLRVFWIAKYSSCFGRLAFMRDAYKLCRRLIVENNIDVINVSEPVVAGPVGVELKRKLRKPLVTQVQGQLLNLPQGTFSSLKTKYISMMTRYSCKHSDRVRTVSDEIRSSVVACGVPSAVVRTVPPRCDAVTFNPDIYVPERDRMRAELGYSENDIIIEFTGRVVAYRDVESDLLALAELLKESDRYHLLIVGDGSDRYRLEGICNTIGIAGHVRFLGRVPFDEVPRMLSLADVFVSTPTNEAIARSVLEAMSMRLPVVATRVGGTPEAITHGVNGMLVDVQCPNQIAECIRYIVADDNRRLDMGRRAREVILEKYEFGCSIRQFADVHFNLLMEDTL